MKNPLVSVICLCYNQSRFVEEALDSVIGQSYNSIELIVVDDGSDDGSKEVITKWLTNYSRIPFVNLKANVGNTTAFNQGLKLAKGKYVIDLAGDDVLLLERVEKQVMFFEKQEAKVGVIYSDAQYVDERGQTLGRHFSNTRLVAYQGDIYSKLIDTYFIPPPTMMMKKEVLDELSGYDEALAYEDFDFWVRSARNWHYAYESEVLTQVRKVTGSHSETLYHQNDSKLFSTFMVCKKIALLNEVKEEDEALINRIKYEIRHAFIAGKKRELQCFFELWREKFDIPFNYLIIKCIGQLGLNFNWLKKPIQALMK